MGNLVRLYSFWEWSNGVLGSLDFSFMLRAPLL